LENSGAAKTAVSKEVEPQITQNTQMVADEAAVNRWSGRCVSYAPSPQLAWICVICVICGSIFLLVVTRLAATVIWLN
jgi:hypothetical protein